VTAEANRQPHVDKLSDMGTVASFVASSDLKLQNRALGHFLQNAY
jgi:hypothetical protein